MYQVIIISHLRSQFLTYLTFLRILNVSNIKSPGTRFNFEQEDRELCIVSFDNSHFHDVLCTLNLDDLVNLEGWRDDDRRSVLTNVVKGSK